MASVHGRARTGESSEAERNRGKETIGRLHLLPALGSLTLEAITTERVQQLKSALNDKAPKTVNNVLTVLNTALRKAVEWDVLDRMPCSIRLLPIPPRSMAFHDFEDYEKLVVAATLRSPEALAVVL